MNTVEEFIEKINLDIEDRKAKGKTTLYYLDAYIDESQNIIDTLTKYYNNQGIAINIKKCPVRNSFEIAIWWD